METIFRATKIQVNLKLCVGQSEIVFSKSGTIGLFPERLLDYDRPDKTTKQATVHYQQTILLRSTNVAKGCIQR